MVVAVVGGGALIAGGRSASSCVLASCLLPHHGQAWPFSPELLSTLMIIDGLIPYITFGGVLLYEARMEGVLGSKKTTSSIAAVVPVDFDPADDAATTRAAVRRNKFEPTLRT